MGVVLVMKSIRYCSCTWVVLVTRFLWESVRNWEILVHGVCSLFLMVVRMQFCVCCALWVFLLQSASRQPTHNEPGSTSQQENPQRTTHAKLHSDHH
jgi:hypothetical protein